MTNISRRNFLKTCAAGFAAAATNAEAFASPSTARATGRKLGRVALGKSGVTVSRLAMGTNGWNHRSNQTRLGMKGFVGLAEYAHDSGIMFFDAVDTYGSHAYLREALKIIPREKVAILTKIWTEPNNWNTAQDAVTTLDRFRQEISDVLLARINPAGSQMDSTPQNVMPVLKQAHDRGAGVIGMKIFGAGALTREVQRQQSLEYVWCKFEGGLLR